APARNNPATDTVRLHAAQHPTPPGRCCSANCPAPVAKTPVHSAAAATCRCCQSNSYADSIPTSCADDHNVQGRTATRTGTCGVAPDGWRPGENPAAVPGVLPGPDLHEPCPGCDCSVRYQPAVADTDR